MIIQYTPSGYFDTIFLFLSLSLFKRHAKTALRNLIYFFQVIFWKYDLNYAAGLMIIQLLNGYIISNVNEIVTKSCRRHRWVKPRGRASITI